MEERLRNTNTRRQARALNTALDTNGDWIREVLKDADGRLNVIREKEGHVDAGGLVIAKDTQHANEIARILEEISGEPPFVAHTKVENPGEIIKLFKDRSDKWIISVQMISEGVDIRRLRVGVYLTNVATKMFFMQATGRVIRWIKGMRTQTAFFYFPECEPFLTFMKEISEEQTDIYKNLGSDPRQEQVGFSDVGQMTLLFQPISSKAESSGQVYQTEHYDPEIINLALQEWQKLYPGIDIATFIGEAAITKIMIDAQKIKPNNAPMQTSNSRRNLAKIKEPKSITEQIGLLKADITSLSNHLAGLIVKTGNYRDFRSAVRAVHSRFANTGPGFQDPSKGIKYHELKIEWLRKQIDKINTGNWSEW